jgi:hypothetical protein
MIDIQCGQTPTGDYVEKSLEAASRKPITDPRGHINHRAFGVGRRYSTLFSLRKAVLAIPNSPRW